MKKFFGVSMLLMSMMILLMASSLNASEIPSGTFFFVQSAQEYGKGLKKGFWDVPGKPTAFKKGMNIQVWDLPNDDRNSRDRLFSFRRIMGNIYEISSMLHSRSRMDVAGGKRVNGTNIGLWENHNGQNQRFKMAYRGGGKWKIYPMIGGVVCLKGKNSNNGSNVHIWNDHNGPWTEWVLIQSGTNRAFFPEQNSPNVRPAANMNGINLLTATTPNHGNATSIYFSRINSAKFIAENSANPLAGILNGLDETKRILLAKEIIRSIANNPDTVARLRVYHQLDQSNIFKSSNFLVQMVVKQVQKEVEKNWRTEKNSTIKTVLFRMTRKF